MKQPEQGVRAYIVTILHGMAQGLFASLIIGLIIKQAGLYLQIELLVHLGMIAQYTMGPAIGVGVALSVGAPPLAVFASAVVGAVGAGTFSFDPTLLVTISVGEPVGALLASLVGAEMGKLLAGKTKVDIILVPLSVILTGTLTALFLSPIVASFMHALGSLINNLTALYPIPMGILVSTVVGMVLTLPISSAAICISLGISGLAAGAATVGCSAQMIGFAIASYRENRMGGLVSQALGTSMIQVPNIIKNWRIWIPPTAASAILGPLSTTLFQMENNAAGAGMGTSGLVGQINTLAVMGVESWWKILLLHLVLPALLSLLFSEILRKKGWIQEGDYQL